MAFGLRQVVSCPHDRSRRFVDGLCGIVACEVDRQEKTTAALDKFALPHAGESACALFPPPNSTRDNAPSFRSPDPSTPQSISHLRLISVFGRESSRKLGSWSHRYSYPGSGIRLCRSKLAVRTIRSR